LTDLTTSWDFSGGNSTLVHSAAAFAPLDGIVDFNDFAVLGLAWFMN